MNLTYPVEVFAGEIGTNEETPQAKRCSPKATYFSGAVGSG